MHVIALVADIRDSKQLTNRKEVQERLKKVCHELNRSREKIGLISPFTITLGDEFQALFEVSDHIWESIFKIEARLHPVRIKYGIGVGDIYTKLNRKSSIGMDGPAFHKAREAVNDLRRDKKFYRVKFVNRDTRLVNHSLDLISFERDSWKGNRISIFSYLLRGESIAVMSEKLGISEQAVYKNIRKGGLLEIQGILKGISKFMAEERAR